MNLTWQGQALQLRPATDTDRAFIFATWMRSYRQIQRLVDYDGYHRGQVRRVERLWPLAHIACRETAPDTIHGWACGVPGLLHYVYVPPDLRTRGLAREVVRTLCGEKLEFTHRWPFDALPKGWRPNEYRLEESC